MIRYMDYFYIKPVKFHSLLCAFALLICVSLLVSCEPDSSTNSGSTDNADSRHSGLLFRSLSSAQTGIDFQNKVLETVGRNINDYDYFYNGAGLSIGDINNDGLADIFFAGNDVPNKIYLNKGNLKFQDITDTALEPYTGWSTGSNMVDINNDGFLDIYVCVSGPTNNPEALRNVLYINNGDLTFTERSKEYGLDLYTRAVQSVFFDFDNDGDLDCWIGSHALPTDKPNLHEWYKDLIKDGADKIRHMGNYLLRNDDGKFVDVTYKANVFNATFALGTIAVDLNDDNALDVYISNDFFIPDNLYQNDGKGGFKDVIKSSVDHMGKGKYSEVSQYMGLAKTEWSWAILLADFDNDGYKDYYVANGFLRETKDNDFRIKVQEEKAKNEGNWDQTLFSLIQDCKSIPIKNNFFSNVDGKQFEDKSSEWSDTAPSFSNGAAYADLDNDGDLDLVVNNLMSEAFVLENLSAKNNWLRVELKDSENPAAIKHAKLELHYDGEIQRVDYFFERGYQSSMEPVAHFGLGNVTKVDKLVRSSSST